MFGVPGKKTSMGSEQTSKYYDEVFSKSTVYNCKYSESGYFPLWKKMEEFLILDIPVLDIGCGTGQVAEFLIEKGYNYTGIDFSEVAINIAKSKNLKNANFIQADINEYNFHFNGKYQIWISEVLEHISDDLLLLKRLANQIKNANIVISIPNFDDPAHVRYFNSKREVRRRYKNLLSQKIPYEIYKLESFYILHGEFQI